MCLTVICNVAFHEAILVVNIIWIATLEISLSSQRRAIVIALYVCIGSVLELVLKTSCVEDWRIGTTSFV